MIKFIDLKKGDKILHSHLGTSPAVSGVIKESPKQGRGVKKTILVDVKGSEVGMFDEIGSIYSSEVLKVFRDNNWQQVIGHPKGAYKNALGIDQIDQDLR
jgi:hypothetical protein